MVRQEDIKRLNRSMDALMSVMGQKKPDVLGRFVSDISIQEMKAAYFLGNYQLLKQSQLADMLMLSKSNTSILIDKLAKKGLVDRSSSEKDRRIVHLKLTKKGHGLFRIMLDHHLSCAEFILSKLNAQEQQQFLSLMDKISQGEQSLKERSEH